jgi:hypothetical protein
MRRVRDFTSCFVRSAPNGSADRGRLTHDDEDPDFGARSQVVRVDEEEDEDLASADAERVADTAEDALGNTTEPESPLGGDRTFHSARRSAFMHAYPSLPSH